MSSSDLTPNPRPLPDIGPYIYSTQILYVEIYDLKFDNFVAHQEKYQNDDHDAKRTITFFNENSTLLSDNITMSKVLEALVAKGRQARRPREQKEVAFGLADLSTHEEMHERILNKGGIKTLVQLLVTSSDIDTQKFSALAIANCSSASYNRKAIAKGNGEETLLHLIDKTKNNDVDPHVRQYCAMALGNLSAEEENHSNIVKLGGIDALVVLLKSSWLQGGEIESGRYAAFALSNLASNSTYRDQIVEDNACIESLVTMCCCEDNNVQWQALSALRAICITPKYRIKVVEMGIIDPLILLSRSENIEILREVAAALNCLSCMDSNKEEICDRAISTIISLLLFGDMEIERHAVCTIANLVENMETHSRFLEERGLPPLISSSISSDVNTKGEASRAIANLTANPDIQQILIKEGALSPMVEALREEEVNCQRFAALVMANLATTVSSQIHVVQAGAIFPLISLAKKPSNQLEARRYSVLALANLSATVSNHSLILDANGGLEALFSLSHSPDTLSQYYVGCALSNLCCNVSNHILIAEEGGIQPIITLAFSSDPDVQQQAVTALRGLSVSNELKMKIVQEGGLEPLSRLLLSEDVEILRETCACLCNLSLGDENKFEIARCGAVPPLISRMQNEDQFISQQSSACLANLAEMSDNQEIISNEGGIRPCISVMRSRFTDVQRESGRLLANICSSDIKTVTSKVVKEGGHQLLISFLLSQDIACQRVGAFGIGNLCTQEQHRVTLMKSGVLEPLCFLSRSEDVELEIQRFAVLGLANLASCVENHKFFINEKMLPVLISLSNSPDAEVRQYSALALVRMSENSEIRKTVTEEGGLEPVLYLARTEEPEIQKEVLAALTTLSFEDDNKIDICKHGGLPAIIASLSSTSDNIAENTKDIMLSCCAVANLTEMIDNMDPIVESKAIPLLVSALALESTNIKREAARALGNLASNLDYGRLIAEQNDALSLLVITLKISDEKDEETKRMAVMALCNLSSNIELHEEIMRYKLLEPITAMCRTVLDPKSKSERETSRFCLLLVSNISVSSKFHSLIMDFMLDILIAFTKDRDLKCRHHAIYTLGNLCSNRQNFTQLVDAGCIKILITFSFPSSISTADSNTINKSSTTNPQFQAVAGLRGLATDKNYRVQIARDGGLEPLILTASSNVPESDIEVKREIAATFCNLALSDENKDKMTREGVLPALIKLASERDDICQIHAVAAMSNLAELVGNVDKSSQKQMLGDGCLKPLMKIAKNNLRSSEEVNKEVARCLALFTCRVESHSYLTKVACAKEIVNLLNPREHNVFCCRFAALAIGNLAVIPENHKSLFDSGAIHALLLIADSTKDVEITQFIAFTFHNIARSEENHRWCEKMGVLKAIVTLLQSHDEQTQFESCLALRFLCISPKARVQFVEFNGLPHLLKFASGTFSSLDNDVKFKREAAAALKNISLSDPLKKQIVSSPGGVNILLEMCRSSDVEVSHQACGVIANLSEVDENQGVMIQKGILQNLKYSILSKSIAVKREAVRAIANLSSAFIYTTDIVRAGTLVPLVNALECEDILCKRFATMGLANLATNKDVQSRMIQEGAIMPLVNILIQKFNSKENHSIEAKRYAMYCLTNMAAAKKSHVSLTEHRLVEVSSNLLLHADLELSKSALLCLANLSSNDDNHSLIDNANCLDVLISLVSHENRAVRLYAVLALRGLSTRSEFRIQIISNGGLDPLLKLCTTSDDNELQMEVLASLCNLSLGGCIGENPLTFLEGVKIQNLLSFLCSADSTYRLFGAVTLGNIASDLTLQNPVIQGGALSPLIEVANMTCDTESQRCIAYAICNLTADPNNRSLVVNEGGIIPLLCLSCSEDPKDIAAGLATLRSLAANPDDRREIYQNGVMEAISHGTDKGDSLCKQEASSLAYAMSLNEENKIDMAKSSALNDIMSLSQENDVKCSLMAMRTLSNLCENEKLHKYIVSTAFELNFLVKILQIDNVKLCGEALRCIANLSSNYSMHDVLIGADVHHELAKLSSSFNLLDRVATFHASLGLMNISQNQGTHTAMNDDQIIRSLCQIINLSDKTDEQNCLRSRRNACLAVGGLSFSTETHPILIQHNILPSLLNAMMEDDSELQMSSVFALNKLAANKDNIERIGETNGVIKELLSLIKTSNLDVKVQSISTLRRLSLADSNKEKIVRENGGLDTLSKAARLEDLEAKRESAACLCYLSLLDKNKISIVKSSVLEPLLKLCQYDDLETMRFALGALANIAEHSSSHVVLVELKNVLHSLIFSMRNRRISIQREATRAISNLLSFKNSHSLFFQENGLSPLFIVSRSADAECQYNSSLCLKKLSSDHSNHKRLIDGNSLEPLIHMIGSEYDNVKVQAGAALREISSNHIYKLLFFEEGRFDLIMESLLSSKKVLELQIIGAGIARHLSLHTRLQQEISDNTAVIGIICEFCISHYDIDLLSQCVGTLVNLSENPKVRKSLVKNGFVDCLIKLGAKGNTEIQRIVSRGFYSLSATISDYPEALEKKSINILLKLLSVNDEMCGRDASGALGNIASIAKKHEIIVDLEGLIPLVKLLDSPFESVQTSTCRALYRLGVSSSQNGQKNRVKMMELGSIPLLVKLSHSQNMEVCKMSSMVICNLSISTPCHQVLIRNNGIHSLVNLLDCNDATCLKYCLKALCNITSTHDTQSHVVNVGGLQSLMRLIASGEKKEEAVELATFVLCNIAAARDGDILTKMVDIGVIEPLTKLLCTNLLKNIRFPFISRAIVLALYNLSTFDKSHVEMIKHGVMKALVMICKEADDIESKQYSIMLLSNLSANKSTRKDATKGGGLQAAILLSKDLDRECCRYACICLANMGNCTNTQRQIVVHGGLPTLVQHSLDADHNLQRYSIMCLGNLSAMESNHSSLMQKGVFEALVKQSSNEHDDIKYSCAFAIANLCSNQEILNKIGKGGGIDPLLMLANSSNTHSQCLGLSALRRLAIADHNRDILCKAGILTTLSQIGKNSSLFEIQREVGACLFNLSFNSSLKQEVCYKCAAELIQISRGKDVEAIRQSLGALANIAEDIENHSHLDRLNVLECLISLIRHDSRDIYREALRALTNMLSSFEFHNKVVDEGLEQMILNCRKDCSEDLEYEYNLALSLRKLSNNTRAHDTISRHDLLTNLFLLLEVSDFKTKRHALITLRDLCANNDKIKIIAKCGGVELLIKIAKEKQLELRTLAVASLRHMSLCDDLKRTIVENGAILICMQFISIGSPDDLQYQVAGLFANLSENSTNQVSMVEVGVTKTIVSLAKHESLEVQKVRMFHIYKLLCTSYLEKIIEKSF